MISRCKAERVVDFPYLDRRTVSRSKPTYMPPIWPGVCIAGPRSVPHGGTFRAGFLPDDYEALQPLSWLGVSLAASENACTAMEFKATPPRSPLPATERYQGWRRERLYRRCCASVGPLRRPCRTRLFRAGLLADAAACGVFAGPWGWSSSLSRPEAWIGHDIPLPKNGHNRSFKRAGPGVEPDHSALDLYRMC